jgi:hypothetical protein
LGGGNTVGGNYQGVRLLLSDDYAGIEGLQDDNWDFTFGLSSPQRRGGDEFTIVYDDEQESFEVFQEDQILGSYPMRITGRNKNLTFGVVGSDDAEPVVSNVSISAPEE